MISAYQIKPKFQQLLKPLLNLLHKAGVSANCITWTAVLLSAVVGVLFWFFPNGHMLWVFAVGLLVRMALNTLDGMMARMQDMKSVPGEILNELGDVLSDAVMYLPLVKLTGVNPWWVLVVRFSFDAERVHRRIDEGGDGHPEIRRPHGKERQGPGFRAHLPAVLFLARGYGILRLRFRRDEHLAGCKFDNPHKKRIGR